MMGGSTTFFQGGGGGRGLIVFSRGRGSEAFFREFYCVNLKNLDFPGGGRGVSGPPPSIRACILHACLVQLILLF